MSSRLRSRLVWRPLSLPQSSAAGTPPVSTWPLLSEEPDFSMPMAPRDKAIALLYLASEIEHALMVQYLYAAYSLNPIQPDEDKRRLVHNWRNLVLTIAREEMGHFVTVQNLLTLIGGALSLERDDYPFKATTLWPFPFELEPLTKVSLGKYVLGEMPSREVLAQLKLLDEVGEIQRRVQALGDVHVNRVGYVYDDLARIFNAGPLVQGPLVPGVVDPHPFIATVDIQAASLQHQVHFSAWGLDQQDILIEVAHDRTSALHAIQVVAAQGEGSTLPDDLDKSHFGKFLSIYRQFPEQQDWRPSRQGPSNPTTNPSVQDPARRIEGPAYDWALLCNLRYRMLLMYLKHSFYVEAPVRAPSWSPRGALVSWAFGEMYNLRALTEILFDLPLRPASGMRAGPPFEMPYSMALPARNADRWRLHRDLLLASGALVDKLLAAGHPYKGYLQALRTADQTALEPITSLIGA